MARGGPALAALLACAASAIGPLRAGPAAPTATNTVYADALGSGWQDWSWDPITRNLSASSLVHGGSASIAITYTGGWSGFQLGRSSGLTASDYDTLRFWIHGGSSGGQQVTVYLQGQGASGDGQIVNPTANTWTLVDLPLSGIGAPSVIDSISWFNSTAGSQPTFFLDDISLIQSGASTATSPPPGTGPALSVDAADLGYSISPYIYGLNFADPQLAADLDLPVNRWGGNATTRTTTCSISPTAPAIGSSRTSPTTTVTPARSRPDRPAMTS